ncbi:hypothetical protein M9H77_27632 [Catharanthus roseus]|uniref:Uncharacterized protein n=1 Tax=Catharanthus roseus TaxID=4058 RepID=A0ACC0ADF6_CATRO|nr:hypothetical protein M9H77_27632 [Catharanthus roseus]
MATSENWQLFVHNGRHNHKIAVYSHGHAQPSSSGRVMFHHAIYYDFFDNKMLVMQLGNSQKIYNVVAKIKRDRMQGRNTLEEVLCLSAERGYIVFYRNGEDSNVLSDIVVAHPTSITMIRTWSYVLIMDMTYKTNKYNMLLLECVRMTPTGKNFTMATALICNEQATTYRWTRRRIRPDFLHYLFSTWLNPFAHKFCRVWTSQVLHFMVETTNRNESVNTQF